MTFQWNPLKKPPRDRAPTRRVFPSIAFPLVKNGEEPGGLKWYAALEAGYPLGHGTLVVPGGVQLDKGAYGLTEVMYRILREETKKRTPPELAVYLERLAMRLSIRVGEDAVLVRFTSPRETWSDALRVFLEILLEPAFSPEVTMREARRMAQQVLAERAEPTHQARVHMRRLLFGNHAYHVVEPRLEILESLDRDTLFRHYENTMNPRGGFWIFTGDVPLEETLKLLENNLPRKESPSVWDECEFPQRQGQGIWVERPHSVQASILMARSGYAADTDQYALRSVANTILGGGASSRLFLHLREAKGYTYGANSNFQTFRDNGFWALALQVRSEVLESAIEDVLNILYDSATQNPTKEEIKAAQRYLCGRFTQTHQDLEQIAERIADCIILGLPMNFWLTYKERVVSVRPSSIRKLYEDWLKSWNIVIVGAPATRKIPDWWEKLNTLIRKTGNPEPLWGQAVMHDFAKSEKDSSIEDI